jgi:hypothetical protein
VPQRGAGDGAIKCGVVVDAQDRFEHRGVLRGVLVDTGQCVTIGAKVWRLGNLSRWLDGERRQRKRLFALIVQREGDSDVKPLKVFDIGRRLTLGGENRFTSLHQGRLDSRRGGFSGDGFLDNAGDRLAGRGGRRSGLCDSRLLIDGVEAED